MTRKKITVSLIVTIFIIGCGYIIYNGRPVKKLEESNTVTQTPAVVIPPNTTTSIAMTPPQPSTTVQTSTTPTPKPTPTDKPIAVTPPSPTPDIQPTKPVAGTYTLADVQTHNTESNCWSAINGSVYDLTSWVSRHPGGEKPILNMCGKDASEMFNKKHGKSSKAQSALILLKIGTLS